MNMPAQDAQQSMLKSGEPSQVAITYSAAIRKSKIEKRYDEKQDSNLMEIEKKVVTADRFINKFRSQTSSKLGKRIQAADHKTTLVLRQHNTLAEKHKILDKQRQHKVDSDVRSSRNQAT